jgi:hypothetical protein
MVDPVMETDALFVYAERSGRVESTGAHEDNIELAEYYGLAQTEALEDVWIGPGAAPPPDAPAIPVQAGDTQGDFWDASFESVDAAVWIVDDRRTWVIAHGKLNGGGEETFVMEPGASPPRRWPKGEECPEGVPRQILIEARLYAFRTGACMRPVLTPAADEDETSRLAEKLGDLLPGDTMPESLLTPYNAAWLIYPGDAEAREQGQRRLSDAGFAGAACGSTVVSHVRAFACAIRLGSADAAASLAAGLRQVTPSLIAHNVREVKTALGVPAVLADTFPRGIYAVLAFPRGSTAYLVVAGPGSPSAVRAVVDTLSRALE